MLQAARVDPRGMLAFFEALHELEGERPTGERYLSTHPTAGDRLRVLVAQPPAEPALTLLGGDDFTAVRRICGARR